MLTLADGRRIMRLQANASIRREDEKFEGIATIEREGNEGIPGMKPFEIAARRLHLFPIVRKVLLQKESNEGA
jgi:hypothetical protein